jgi:virginiamycin B lyase
VLQRSQANQCDPLSGARVLKSTLASVQFDAVTKYPLPSPGRFPNALTAAADGSVWFGEQSVPGIGHLFQNGSLVEYAWPSSPSSVTAVGSCQFKTSIWGVAVWNGLIWGTDSDGNRIVGLDPSKSAFQILTVPVNDSFPYSLAVGPDNSLWFTMLSTPPRLGRVDTQGQIHLFSIPADRKDIPADISFRNSTTGYFVGIEPQAGNGSVYEFNPMLAGPTIAATRVGGAYKLYSPNSISANGDSIWVTEHGAASLATYGLQSKAWRVFPTSTENYTSTTLPYFVRANGSRVWFNEHYGNKIAMIDTQLSTLTEYSVSNPPVTNGSQIDNALTISVGRDRTWFTAVTANYVGFVSAKYRPTFGIGFVENSAVTLARGTSQRLTLGLLGDSQAPLQVKFSDSESPSSRLQSITISSTLRSLSSLTGQKIFSITISADTAIAPGEYTLVITATDGIVSRSVFASVTVT